MPCDLCEFFDRFLLCEKKKGGEKEERRRLRSRSIRLCSLSLMEGGEEGGRGGKETAVYGEGDGLNLKKKGKKRGGGREGRGLPVLNLERLPACR